MASKRKQSEASSSSKGKKKTAPPPLDRDTLNEHANILDSFKKRPIIPERGIILEPPFAEYFQNQKWDTFISAGYLGPGSRSLVNTVFQQLKLHPGNKIKLTSYMEIQSTLDISPKAINAFLEIPSGGHDEYSAFLKSKYNVRDVIKELTGTDGGSTLSLKSIKRQDLCPRARYLNLLVSHRLMQVTSNPKVEEKRALLIYAISKGMTIDIGAIINKKILAMTDLRSKTQAIGFPSLITAMCRKAHIRTPTDAQDEVKLKQPLSWSMFHKPTRGASSSGARGDGQEGTEDDKEDEGEADANQI